MVKNQYLKIEFFRAVVNLNKLENEYQAYFNMKRFKKADKSKFFKK
jgi:hypothetical protein